MYPVLINFRKVAILIFVALISVGSGSVINCAVGQGAPWIGMVSFSVLFGFACKRIFQKMYENLKSTEHGMAK